VCVFVFEREGEKEEREREKEERERELCFWPSVSVWKKIVQFLFIEQERQKKFLVAVNEKE